MKHLFLEKEFSFSFSGITFSLKGNIPVLKINTLLKKMLDFIKKKVKKLLITIDEVENSFEMRKLVQVFKSFNREDYPIDY